MRITNNYIQRSALGHLQTNMQALSEALQHASTGKRILQASDDPAGTSMAMRTRSSLRALDQYQANVDDAKSKAAMEESVLDQLTDLLTRAKQLAISQGGSTASDETRAATKEEVDQLLQQTVTLGNTRFGDQYLFGGQYGDTPPFDPDQTSVAGSYYISLDPDDNTQVRLPSDAPETAIAEGQTLTAVHTGAEVFVDSGVLSSLQKLSEALAAGKTATDVQAALGEVDDAFDEVQTVLSETGARTDRLDVASSNLSALNANLTAFQSQVEGVDLEKAVTELVTRQTAYQAAMLATSKVMGLTLADYLR
ncbi:MAG TPA: flagellar hook-associated protein FlgL [Longimicrobiaceae bacterium]|nr:flagellar hook-associated protein FlgL [Longimicrobiaceae bacterium]